METPSSDVKYHKLATEYSKIRANANVLKRALLEEQNKSAGLREALRQKDGSLRRFEQEVDSLGFRNKQLEHRVASLQEDLDRESKQKQTNKNSKLAKTKTSTVESANNVMMATDKLFVEEFQKKILENSQLISLIADKNAEIDMQSHRITELEQQISNISAQHADAERSLRKDIDNLIAKNSSLETKISDETSIIGSDDALSVSESEHTPTHLINSNDERISKLERELFHWKTKYELLEKESVLEISTENNLKIGDSFASDHTAKGLLVYNHLSKKLEDLFEQKCLAESKAMNFVTECESLQQNLNILHRKLSKNELKFEESQRNLQISEEDLATTRINYEEQISVLTEQVISLSEQLASLK